MSGDNRHPRIFMMDLWATVPYYTAYLSRALLKERVNVQVGSISYYLDPTCFSSRGIKLDPLERGNSFFLLWMMLGYLIVTSVLVLNFGRLGDMFGRVRMYNLGFLIFTIASVLLSVDWMTGRAGAPPRSPAREWWPTAPTAHPGAGRWKCRWDRRYRR